MKNLTSIIRKVVLVSLILAFSFIMPGTAARAEDALTLQVHPYLPAAELLKRFGPLADYLSSETGQKIICHISRDYEEHIELIGMDKVDIAYMGPASYVKTVDRYGRKPLLARIEVNSTPYFQGVIVSSTKSSITTLKDIAGRSFAFGDPDSTMSNIIPLYMLRQAGISLNDLSAFNNLKSHHNVALGVLMGDFDAGAVKEEVFHHYKSRGLRDIAWSPKISEHLFITRSSMPESMVKVLREAMIMLKEDKKSSPILTSIKNDISGFVPVRDEDYTDLRRIMHQMEKSGRNP